MKKYNKYSMLQFKSYNIIITVHLHKVELQSMHAVS